MKIKTIATIFLVQFFLICSAYAAQFTVEKIDKNYAVDGRPRIIIRNGDGRTILRAQPGNTVQVHVEKEVHGVRDEAQARKEAGRIDLRMRQSGNMIEIISKSESTFSLVGGRPRVLTHINVLAPPEADLVVHASDGESDVTGFSGQIEVEAADGRLTASELKGSLQLSVADGELRITDCSGEMDFGVADGNMFVDRCSGRMNADAADGRIRIVDFQGQFEGKALDGEIQLNGILDVVRARTADGSMEIRAQRGSKMTSDWLLRASDGNVVLHLPEDFAADVAFETSDGEIVTQIPVAVTGSVSRRDMAGRIKEGGKLLQIQTADGDITIIGETSTSK